MGGRTEEPWPQECISCLAVYPESSESWEHFLRLRGHCRHLGPTLPEVPSHGYKSTSLSGDKGGEERVPTSRYRGAVEVCEASILPGHYSWNHGPAGGPPPLPKSPLWRRWIVVDRQDSELQALTVVKPAVSAKNLLLAPCWSVASLLALDVGTGDCLLLLLFCASRPADASP